MYKIPSEKQVTQDLIIALGRWVLDDVAKYHFKKGSTEVQQASPLAFRLLVEGLEDKD